MKVQDELEKALHNPEPYEQLRRIALELASQGQSQQQIYNAFDQFRAQLRESDRKQDEDVVIDVMDCICGWCSPQSKLFDS